MKPRFVVMRLWEWRLTKTTSAGSTARFSPNVKAEGCIAKLEESLMVERMIPGGSYRIARKPNDQTDLEREVAKKRLPWTDG